jgi:hypothetical protein
MFEEIWEERPHFCEVTGKPIDFFSSWCFHHVLTKKAYPSFHLYKNNILMCLPEVHQAIEMGTIRQEDKNWIKEMHDSLRREYYERSRQGFGRFYP